MRDLTSLMILSSLWLSGCDSSDSNSGGLSDASAPSSSDDGSTPAPTEGSTDSPGSSETDDGPLFTGGDPISVETDDTDEEPEAEEPEPPLVACEEATATGEQPLIDDFESASDATLEQDGRAGTWYNYNSVDDEDHVMEWVLDPARPSGENLVLHTSGVGYQWSGVGIELRSGTLDEDGVRLNCLYDASIYEGVRFWARGNGEGARLTLSVPGVIPVFVGGICEDTCWATHGVDLAISDEWAEYFLPFGEFTQPSWGKRLGPLDPTQLRHLQFEFAAGSEFELWIDDLSFYGSVPTAPSPDASDAAAPSPDAAADDAGSIDPSDPVQEDTDAGAEPLDASSTSVDGGS